MKEKLKVIHSLQLMMYLVQNGFAVSKVIDSYHKQVDCVVKVCQY